MRFLLSESASPGDPERVPCEGQQRVDLILSRVLPSLSRSQLQARVLRLEVNGKAARLSKLVRQGDLVEVDLGLPPPSSVEPEQVDLEVLYENSEVLVLNKKRGVVVHPGAGNKQGTIAAGLLFRGLNGGDFEDEQRPGIVHRLDKQTSGVLITAKSRQSLEYLSSQFRERTTRKQYVAVSRVLETASVSLSSYESPKRIENRIGRDLKQRQKFCSFSADSTQGKPAISTVRLLGSDASRRYALFSVEIETGRTHQIRVHLSGLGFPVVGDEVYGLREDRSGRVPMLLHAYRVAISLLPGEAARVLEAPIPPDIVEFIRQKGIE